MYENILLNLDDIPKTVVILNTVWIGEECPFLNEFLNAYFKGLETEVQIYKQVESLLQWVLEIYATFHSSTVFFEVTAYGDVLSKACQISYI